MNQFKVFYYLLLDLSLRDSQLTLLDLVDFLDLLLMQRVQHDTAKLYVRADYPCKAA
jgi:hypothetical protein